MAESKKYLVAGLGNIGAEYANTRHNAGFLVADALAKGLGAEFGGMRYGSVARKTFKGRQIFILKPSTYMNLSGKAIAYYLRAGQIPIENLLVVVDDKDIPAGALRMKKKGGDAGHNGLNSIISELGTEEFSRLRVGIGNDFARGSQVDYVLGNWTAEEEKIMKEKIPLAAEAVKAFILMGPDHAMNGFNNR